MRMKRILRWELLLALGLVGCTAVAPGRLGVQPPVTALGPAAPGAAGAVRAPSTTLFLKIRWPAREGYAAQVIPTQTEAIVVSVLKSGSVIKRHEQRRPAPGAEPVTTLSFDLDPGLEQVDLRVEGLDAAGKVLVRGEQLGVPLRDNTATGISVRLAYDGVTMRYERQLVVLNDLRSYVRRFGGVVGPTGQDLATAFGALSERSPLLPLFFRALLAPPDDAEPPAAPGSGEESPVEFGALFDNWDWQASALGSRLMALAWPGHHADWAFDDATHRLDVAVRPSPGEEAQGTTADLFAQLEAGEWVPSPLVRLMLSGSAPDETWLSHELHPLGEWQPATGSLSALRLGADVVPEGRQDRRVTLGFEARDFVASASVPYAASWFEVRPVAPVAARGEYPGEGPMPPPQPGPFGERVPTRLQLIADLPTARATASVQLSATTLSLTAPLWLKDAMGSVSRFEARLDATPSAHVRSGRLRHFPDPLRFGFADPAEQLAFEGTVTFDMGANRARMVARILDTSERADRKLLATLEQDWNLDANGDLRLERLRDWPVLTVNDEGQRQYRLTPGFFTGEEAGHVTVEVK